MSHVGSPGYLDEGRRGAVDMTSAVRSPGSTLKPLIYGLAFESGIAHPETLIEDRPARFGRGRRIDARFGRFGEIIEIGLGGWSIRPVTRRF